MNGNSEKIINLLTVCRRAGRMEMGFDSSKDAILSGKADLILLASDISAKTEKEVRFFADKRSVRVVKTEIEVSRFGSAIGKKAAVIAICDNGFAKAMTRLTVPSEDGAAI